MAGDQTERPEVLAYARPSTPDERVPALPDVAGLFFLGALCAGAVGVIAWLMVLVLGRPSWSGWGDSLAIPVWVVAILAGVGSALLQGALAAWQFLSGWRLAARSRRWVFWSGFGFLPVTAMIVATLGNWLVGTDLPIGIIVMALVAYPLLAPLWLVRRAGADGELGRPPIHN